MTTGVLRYVVLKRMPKKRCIYYEIWRSYIDNKKTSDAQKKTEREREREGGGGGGRQGGRGRGGGGERNKTAFLPPSKLLIFRKFQPSGPKIPAIRLEMDI